MTTYYTLTAAGNLERLEPPVVIDGRQRLHPSPAQAARLGAYPRNDDAPAPTPPEGKVAVPDSWEVRDGQWHRTYRYEDAPPPPPRRWSRLTVKTALAQSGMLAAARSYLAGVEVAPGYMAAEALTDCDYVEEGYPDAERWSAMLDGLATALNKSRSEIDTFLDMIPTENWQG